MFELYLAFFAAHKIAAVFFILQLAMRPVWKYFDLQPSEDERAGWVNRYKELPGVARGFITTTVLSGNSLMAEWWLLNIAVPGVTGGPIAVLATLLQAAVGIGLGLSVGKALTERDYSWVERK